MQRYVEILGKRVKDKVTDLRGVVTSVTFDLYGCVQAWVTPGVDKDQKQIDGGWYDFHRLEVVDDIRVMPLPPSVCATPIGAFVDRGPEIKSAPHSR